MGELVPNPAAPAPSLGPPLCFGPEHLRVSSFNGRGILVDNYADRKRYLNYLRPIVARSDIVCLQEVHSLEADMVFTFEREFPGWTVIASHCLDNGLLMAPLAGV